MGPVPSSLKITAIPGPGEFVLAIRGRVGPADVPDLRARLLDAVDRADGDVLIDTHQVDAFDDAALTALTAARKRARFLRHRIVVLDAEDSVVALSLRRTGMHIRLPVAPDAATAAHDLAVQRQARARLSLHQDRASRSSSAPRPRTSSGAEATPPQHVGAPVPRGG